MRRLVQALWPIDRDHLDRYRTGLRLPCRHHRLLPRENPTGGICPDVSVHVFRGGKLACAGNVRPALHRSPSSHGLRHAGRHGALCGETRSHRTAQSGPTTQSGRDNCVERGYFALGRKRRVSLPRD